MDNSDQVDQLVQAMAGFGGGGRSRAIQAMSGVWILAVASRIRSASLDVLAQYRRAGDTAKGRNVTRTNYPRLT